MKSVRIIVTGGTLDKIHDIRLEGLGFDKTGKTHLPEILDESRCYFPVIEELLLKDSLYFDDADRLALLHAVQAATETAIIITHGTSTMGQTAKFLGQHTLDKTIVLTGAIRPFTLGRSDAQFNLGGAIIGAQTLENGVWGIMNGRIFPAEQLIKNEEAGRFDL